MSVAVLGRVLDPHDFGIVAAAISVMVLLHQVRDLSIGGALVQREKLDAAHISSAFTFSVYLGVVLGITLFVLAPWIGSIYGIYESIDVLRALSLLFIFRGMSTVPLAMCRRAMNFRAIAAVDATTYTMGATVSMTLAVSGAGPWSLVGGYVVEETLSAILYLRLQRPPKVSPWIDVSKLRDLLGFGLGQTIVQLANMLAVHGDNFVVGRALGAEQLGFYTRAYDLIKLPALIYANVVGNVLVPAFSRLQNDRERLAAGFRRATFANALVLFPASAALLVVAPEAIRVVMGNQWDAAVLPFRILVLTMFMRTSFKVGTAVVLATGSAYAVAVSSLVFMTAVIGGALFTIRWGIPGVATSTAIAIAIVYVHCSILAMRASHLPGAALLGAHVPGLVIALLVGAASWPVAEALRGGGVPAAATFAAVGVLSIALTGAAILLWMRSGAGDAKWLKEELGGIRKRLGRKAR